MEDYAWHAHAELAYYEGVKDGASGAEKKTKTGWLTDYSNFDYLKYYEKGYDDGKK